MSNGELRAPTIWLPYDGWYRDNVEVLLDRELRSSAIASLAALRHMLDPDAFPESPEARQWGGHGLSLCMLSMHCSEVMAARGDPLGKEQLAELVGLQYLLVAQGESWREPEWWGAPEIHRWHRWMLGRRDLAYWDRISGMPEGECAPVHPGPQGHERPEARRAMAASGLCECSRRRASVSQRIGDHIWWSCADCRRPNEHWLRAMGPHLPNHTMSGGPMDGVEASTEDMIANPSLVEGYSPSGELSGELLMEGERIIWQLRVEETAA